MSFAEGKASIICCIAESVILAGRGEGAGHGGHGTVRSKWCRRRLSRQTRQSAVAVNIECVVPFVRRGGRVGRAWEIAHDREGVVDVAEECE